MLIDDRGWRGTFEVWAVLTFVVIGVTAAVVAPRSNSGGPAPRPLSPRVFAGERRFRRLYVALVLVSPGFYAPLAFLNDYAVDEGVSESAAAWLVGIIGGATVVSRLVIGATAPAGVDSALIVLPRDSSCLRARRGQPGPLATPTVGR